jgi:hypothetical protein
MPKKQSNRKAKAGRGKRNALVQYVSRFDSNHPEHFLTYSVANVGIGLNSAGGSLAFNSQLINNSLIQLGTGRDKRVGNHIILTRLKVRLYVSCSMLTRVRCIVLANPRDAYLEQQTSTANLTAAIEASPILMAAQHGTAALGPVDYLIDPACDYTILHDQMYGMASGGGMFASAAYPMTTGAGIQYGACIVPIELDIPLALPQIYNNSGVPQTGDWAIYLASTTANTAGNPQAVAWGSVMLQYVDALNLEAIGTTIKDFIDNAGSTIDHFTNSRFYQQLHNAAPYAAKVWGLLAGA